MQNTGTFDLESVTIEKITMEVIEGVNESFLRPYNINVNQGTVEAIGGFHERNLLGQVTPSLVASNMNDALTIGAPRAVAGIPHGWGSVRARFSMQVNMKYRGTTGHSVVTLNGFTDYYDDSLQGTVDPNINLIVNSYHTSKGSGLSTGVVALSSMYGYDQDLTNNLYDMSPNVAVGAISTNSLISGHEYKNLGITDTSTMLSHRPTQTDRSYLNPSTYIARLMNDYAKVSSGVEEVSSMSESFSTDENLSLSYSMYSGDYKSNPFIAYMAEEMQTGNSGRSFTLKDIYDLDPTAIDDRFVVVDSRNNGATYARESQDLSSVSIESHIAHTASSALPGIMSSMGAVSVSFIVSNMTIDGTMALDLKHITMATGLEATNAHSEYLTNRVIAEIMTSLSMNGLYKFTLMVDTNLTMDSTMSVTMEGGITTPFVIPVFADSLYNPVVTNSIDDSDTLVMGVESLLNYVASPVTQ